MHLGGEKLRHNLEGGYRGVRGRTPMDEYHGGLHLEHSKGTRRSTRDQVSLHTIRTETNIGLKLISAGQTRESVLQTRFWRLRPDDLVFRLPTKTIAGTLCILEFKCMSDVTDQCLTRARSRTEDQYVSLKRALGVTLQHQGWKVEQISLKYLTRIPIF